MKEKAPTLSFQCPKLWKDMSGSETKRFCEQCGHHVQNLSLLDEKSRNELLSQAKTERVCGTYFQDLEGNLITADSEESLAAKVKALRLAALASGAIALASCSSETTTHKHVPPESDDVVQLAGMICAPEDHANESAIPTTGPSENSKPGGILGGAMEDQ